MLLIIGVFSSTWSDAALSECNEDLLLCLHEKVSHEYNARL